MRNYKHLMASQIEALSSTFRRTLASPEEVYKALLEVSLLVEEELSKEVPFDFDLIKRVVKYLKRNYGMISLMESPKVLFEEIVEANGRKVLRLRKHADLVIKNIYLMNQRLIDLKLNESFISENLDSLRVIMPFLNFVADTKNDLDVGFIMELLNPYQEEREFKEETLSESHFETHNKKLSSFLENYASLFKVVGSHPKVTEIITGKLGDDPTAKIHFKGGFFVYVPLEVGGIVRYKGREYMPRIYTNWYEGVVVNPYANTNYSRMMFSICEPFWKEGIISEVAGYLKNKLTRSITQAIFQPVVRKNRDGQELLYSFFTDVSDFTDGQKTIERHMIYMPQTIRSGDFSVDMVGKKGQNVFNHIIDLTPNEMYDPSVLTTGGNKKMLFLFEDRKPLAEMLNPFCLYDKEDARITLSVNNIITAADYGGSDTMLTVGDKRINGLFPSKRRFIAYFPATDKDGVATVDGTFLMKGVPTGMKVSNLSSQKGIIKNINDSLDLFIKINGEFVSIDATGPYNLAGRQNYGLAFQGLYNLKKYIEGNLEQQELDVVRDGLKMKDLADLQTVYRLIDGKYVSQGKWLVGLHDTYLVRESESSFKSNRFSATFGTESIHRFIVNRQYDILNSILNRSIEQKMAELISHKETVNVYGKYGAMNELMRGKTRGIFGTALPNVYLKPDEAMAIILPEDVEKIESMGFKFKDDRVVVNNPMQQRYPLMDSKAHFWLKKLTIIVSTYRIMYVNPRVWAESGGDFDGDLVFFHFFYGSKAKEEAERYSYENQVPEKKPLEHLGFPGTLKQMSENWEDVESFLFYFLKEKKGEAFAREAISKVFKDGEIIQLSEEDRAERFYKMYAMQFVTMASKETISRAKSLTMSGLMYITHYIESFGATDEQRSRLLRNIDAMNWRLVQPTISMAKHTSNIAGALKTILMIDKMNLAITLGIKSKLKMSYSTFKAIMDLLVKNKIIYFNKQYSSYSFAKGHGPNDLADRQLIKPDSLFSRLYTYFEPEIKVSQTWRNELYIRYDGTNEVGSWNGNSDLDEMIDILDPEGEVFKTLEKIVDGELKDFDFFKNYLK